MYELAALESELHGTIFAGKLHFVAVTGSTNTDATEAARAGAPHGSVYFADEQTAGRGRGNHVWHSAAGEGLYVSVLLRPDLPAMCLPLLPLAVGLAAAEAVQAAAELAVDLRWPNDLLIGPRKTGGILAEAQSEAGAITFAVIGIGINVHQRSFDPELATPATSLDVESGRFISRQAVLVALLRALETEVGALSSTALRRALPARGGAWAAGLHRLHRGPGRKRLSARAHGNGRGPGADRRHS
jgi:BirA family biotin operon repressor/biotin-[acetyl-CoA-carboxylase] ligase